MTGTSLFEYTIFLEQEDNSIESQKQIQIEKTQANNSINENELVNDIDTSIINTSKNKEFKLKQKLYNPNKIGGKSTNNKTQNIFLNQKTKRFENNKVLIKIKNKNHYFINGNDEVYKMREQIPLSEYKKGKRNGSYRKSYKR